jgi:thiamine-phosphate pyrophosphorylase
VSSFEPASLYPIIDVTPSRPPEAGLALAEEVLAAGAPWLQLRAKDLGGAAFLDLARALVRLASRHGGKVIVNDRLDVALASGASGVHLGQEDLPPRAARERVRGREMVIGVSTHSVAQAVAAVAEGADYVGFGPMYATVSKANPLPARRATDLRAVREAIPVPIVAIGGITGETAAEVLRAGASSVAIISALANDPRPGDFARRILAIPAAARAAEASGEKPQ